MSAHEIFSPYGIMLCKECGKYMTKLPNTATCLNEACPMAGVLVPHNHAKLYKDDEIQEGEDFDEPSHVCIDCGSPSPDLLNGLFPMCFEVTGGTGHSI